MKEFFAIANVVYYDECEVADIKETIILTEIENFQDAMSRIEAYYAQDLESVQIELFEGPFIKLSPRYAEMLAAGELEEE